VSIGSGGHGELKDAAIRKLPLVRRAAIFGRKGPVGLLSELVPRASAVAVLLNPNNPTVDVQLREVQEAARSLGPELHTLYASSEGDCLLTGVPGGP
jgi:hypothetical protein